MTANEVAKCIFNALLESGEVGEVIDVDDNRVTFYALDDNAVFEAVVTEEAS